MMKFAIGPAAIGIALLLSTAPALAGTPVEEGYKPGALGVSAIMTGDYSTASAQLAAMNGVTKHDPARLINLGNAYAGMGRYRDAERAYASALKSSDVDLVLANGSVMSSRTIAKAALRRIPVTFASR